MKMPVPLASTGNAWSRVAYSARERSARLGVARAGPGRLAITPGPALLSQQTMLKMSALPTHSTVARRGQQYPDDRLLTVTAPARGAGEPPAAPGQPDCAVKIPL